MYVNRIAVCKNTRYALPFHVIDKNYTEDTVILVSEIIHILLYTYVQMKCKSELD